MRENRRVYEAEHKVVPFRRQSACIRKRRTSTVRFTAMFLAVVLSVMAGFVISGRSANAVNPADGASSFKYYKEVRITSGTTLWELADFYCSTAPDELDLTTEDCMKEIRQVNQLSDGHLQSGEYIIVPYYSNILK